GTTEVRGRFEAVLTRRGYPGRRNVLDIALASVEFFHLFSINIYAQDAKTDRVVAQHQRKAYIAKSNDADQGFPFFELLHNCWLDSAHSLQLAFKIWCLSVFFRNNYLNFL